MAELLKTDHVGDRLCPCGAPPAPGSAYCGEDCTHTHMPAFGDLGETKPWRDPWADVMA